MPILEALLIPATDSEWSSGQTDEGDFEDDPNAVIDWRMLFRTGVKMAKSFMPRRF